MAKDDFKVIHIKGNPRKATLIDAKMYEKNKEAHYDPAGYVVATPEDAIAFLKRNHFNIGDLTIEAPKTENKTPPKTEAKKAPKSGESKTDKK